jgi:branched-chain amino acid aminotransferase
VKFSINGCLTEAPESSGGAIIDPTDRGLTLGDGLFETISISNGKILRLNAHLDRLRQGASILDIELSMNNMNLIATIDSLVKANKVKNGAIRLTLTRGPSFRGLLPPRTTSPSLIITTSNNASDFDAFGCVKAIMASVTRCNEKSPLSRIKSLNYLDNILALNEARAKGADDALLLNSAGKLTSASTSNLFAVLAGKLVTPPERDGCLSGIMRAEVIRELDVVQQSIFPMELAEASEAFLTNCLSVRPLISFNGKTIGDGKVGIVTRQVQNLVLEIR